MSLQEQVQAGLRCRLLADTLAVGAAGAVLRRVGDAISRRRAGDGQAMRRHG